MIDESPRRHCVHVRSITRILSNFFKSAETTESKIGGDGVRLLVVGIRMNRENHKKDKDN